jgi:hypothetical protein
LICPELGYNSDKIFSFRVPVVDAVVSLVSRHLTPKVFCGGLG